MAFAAGSQGHAAGPFESLKELGRTALDILQTRFDLLVTEISEEQGRLAELLLYAALALFCLFLAAVIVAGFVIASLWDTPWRLLATGVMFAGLVGGGVACSIAFFRKAGARPRPFSTSLDELGADLERLQ